jgi:hypothetical protein
MIIFVVMKMSKKLRNAMLSTLVAGPIMLLAPPAGAQYVPPPNPEVGPAVVPTVLAERLTEPKAQEPPKSGILSRTGAETMPLVRDGLAALALGAGLVAVARRRRAEVAPA